MSFQALKSVVMVGGKFGSHLGSAMADGKINLQDVPELLSAVAELKGLSGIDLKSMPSLASLSPAEMEELVAAFKSSFDIPQDEIEAKIEGALSLGVKVAGLVEEVIEFAKSMKKPAAAVV